MRKTTKRIIAIVLCVLMIMSTAAVSFGASVGKVKSLKLDSSTKTQITFRWNAVSKATGYQVYLYDAAKKAWKFEAKTSSNIYTDKNLEVGKGYTYRVRAYITKSGKTTYGEYSAKFNAVTKPAKPVKPATSKVTPTSVKLSWTAAKGATGYAVYVKNPSTGKYEKIGSTTKLNYTATFASAPGTTYFRIASYAKASGKTAYSDKSPAVKAVMKPKKVDTLTVTNVTGSSATLNWTAPVGASEYVVYKKDVTTAGEFEKLATTADTKYVVKYPSAPGTAYFRVRAISKPFGKQVNASVSPTVSVSFKPAKVAAVEVKDNQPHSLTLGWAAASGASEYEVYMYNTASKKYEMIGVAAKNSYLVENLDPAATYSFKVRAVSRYSSKVLYADYSPVLTATTIFGEITGYTFAVDSANKLVLSWNPIKGADGYLVEKRTDNDWMLIGNINSNVFEASAGEPSGKLAEGKEYIYRVRAYINTESGTEYSAYSSEAVVHSITAAPSDIKTATGSEDSIVIEWKKVKGADCYEIFAYNNDSGEWISFAVTEGSTYTVNGEEYVYYTDKGIEESGTYQYKVRAIVYNNGKECYSPFSSVVSHDYTYYKKPDENFIGELDKTGLLGYLYDPKEGCFYTADDPWQRNFGFNAVYDVVSQWVMIQYDTVRFKFEYQGTDWMIQPWKGQYGWVLYGGEIGVYKKYSDREAEHYDCARDEDLLMMSMSLYRYYPETGTWEHIFDRPYDLYWWCTGFVPGFIRYGVPGQTTYPDIRLDFRITMKDFEMLRAFTASLKEQGFAYTTDGLDVYFSYR